MRLRFLAPTAALSLAAALAPASDAHACGGCFHAPVIQQSGATVVTGHRMALTTSPTQSVLWDQIQYSGDPTDFAWVLPVHHGAVLEESTDAWFETLEGATVAQITSPQIICPSVTTPQGCSGSLALSGVNDFEGTGTGGGDGEQPPVTVLHEGTVGPYETVTLATDTPGALNAWLTAHGYNVDADIQPVIDAYVTEDFDFIALRLRPDQGVRAMKPVRVVTPGAGMTLPLRMVAAGTGADVAITLYTITEGRLDVDQYSNIVFPQDKLVWDFQAQSSNYATLRADLLKKNAGFTWLTSFAQQGALLSPNYSGGYSDTGGYYGNSLADVYVAQGQSDGETTDTSCAAALDQIADSTELVVDPCPPGVGPDDPSCGQLAPGQIDARTLACGAVDDMAVALTGLHPRDVWLTRLEADLPRLALKKDLSLTPASDQSPVSNYLQAPVGINEDGLCPAQVPPLSMIAPGYGKAAGSGRGVDRRSAFGYAVMGLLLASAVARRRRRK